MPVPALSPTSMGPTSTVRLDRNGAVGWRDIALDGLNCYLRCIEAILRGAGLTTDEVTEELGGAITDRLGQDGSPYFQLRGSTARWLIAPAGDHHWDQVNTKVSAGQPVLIWPDGYFWPGDIFEGRRHIHHHAVLAVRIDGGELHFLDIDADEAQGFARAVPITEATMRACTRVLELPTVAPGPRLTAADVRQMIMTSVGPLARLANATEELADWWAAAPTRRLAHAVDLFVLGDIQPQLYLFASICKRFGYDVLATKGFEVAALAKKISLFLFGLHRYKPIAPYDLCREDIVLLAQRLRAAQRAATDSVGMPSTVAESPAGPWLWQRLDALSRWHFDAGLDTMQPTTPPRAGRQGTP